MLTITEIQQLITDKLEKEPLQGTPKSLYEPIGYIMSNGGKRLRPALVVMAAQLFGEPDERVLDAALGIEIFHNFTLMHDDIMDQAPIRRGKSTVHTRWDVNTAILSGDTMMVMAYDLFLRNHNAQLPEVLCTFNQTAREVCEGQQYDMDFEKRENVSIEEYLEMIRLKTSVLMAASLKIGGLLGGAPANDLENLYCFGEKIGLAFQLKDDLLDIFGDIYKFGKQTGNDIITNKKTYLLVKCMAEASPEDKAELLRWLTVFDAPAEKIATVTSLYQKYHIEQQTNETIENLYREGMQFLERIETSPERKAPLYEFTDSLKLRDR